MKTKEMITKRLDLNPQLVERAKVAYRIKTKKSIPENLEEVYFREMLDAAVNDYLPQVEEMLTDIGLLKMDIVKRQRPVSITTWQKLDVVVNKFDITKIQIIRCLLQLMARSQGDRTTPNTNP